MTYAIIRLIYFVYFMGIALIGITSFSRSVFQKNFKVKTTFEALWFSLIWPTSLFSQGGRDKLVKHISFWQGGNDEDNHNAADSSDDN